MKGPDLAADVNGDGVVNILDLVLVAGAFGNTAAAPSAHPQAIETLTAADVQQWLTDARSLEVKDATMARGIVVLEQLLASLTPTETSLLPNYPNPFNPETWIPYRLAEDAFVTLTIYDGIGRVVRTLDVGHRIASAYESRSKAVYWDGRNDLRRTSGKWCLLLPPVRRGLFRNAEDGDLEIGHVGGASCPALRRHMTQRINREPPSKPKKPSITKRTACNIWYILLFNDYHIQTETPPLTPPSCTNHFRCLPMAGK